MQLNEEELASKLQEAEEQLRAVLPGEWQGEVSPPTEDTQGGQREGLPGDAEEDKEKQQEEEEDVPSDLQESPLDGEKEEDENAKRVAQLALVVKYFKVSVTSSNGTDGLKTSTANLAESCFFVTTYVRTRRKVHSMLFFAIFPSLLSMLCRLLVFCHNVSPSCHNSWGPNAPLM